jgi:hypothetical protein
MKVSAISQPACSFFRRRRGSRTQEGGQEIRAPAREADFYVAKPANYSFFDLSGIIQGLSP